MPPIFQSGDYTIATPVSNPEFTAPFPGVNVDYVLKQRFQQNLADFTPLALNTPHPDFTDFLLVEESPKRDIQGLVCEWERTYAKVPAQYSQPSSMAYQFIGYLTTDSPAIIGRNQFTETVAARIQYDYFLLDKTSGNITDADGNTVYTGTPDVLPSLVNVPVLQTIQYFSSNSTSVQRNEVDTVISYGPDAASPQTSYPVPAVPPTAANPPYSAYPTREVYEAWIAKTTTVEVWDGETETSTDLGIYEIPAIASVCVRWLGLIVERATTFIRPK